MARSPSKSEDRRTVVVLCGTRPEAIKLAPVILTLAGDHRFVPVVVLSGQHPTMAAGALADFGITADADLAVRSVPGAAESLTALTGAILGALDPVLDRVAPDAVIVQGDTTTAMAGAVAGFSRRVVVAHVEAGLRTGDRSSPFPEEVNRRAVAVFADLHLAPTDRARLHLIGEGVKPDDVFVTGNTVVDAVRLAAAGREPYGSAALEDLDADPTRKVVLVTAHRRESWGEPMAGIGRAVRRIVDGDPDVVAVVPVHPNPGVRAALLPPLAGHDRILVCDPLGYRRLARLLRRADLVLTDSGGLQEEAPSFGVPVLVLRDTTERPEGVAAGCTRLVGTDPDVVVSEARSLLAGGARYRAMAEAPNPYGDGRAAPRCVAALARRLA